MCIHIFIILLPSILYLLLISQNNKAKFSLPLSAGIMNSVQFILKTNFSPFSIEAEMKLRAVIQNNTRTNTR